jgi:hypothetical protein
MKLHPMAMAMAMASWASAIALRSERLFVLR